MSVLIKGMEMPNNCHECELVDILTTCPCRKMADEDFWNNVSLAVEGHKDCPLSEVKTPHGRLIDADALHYSRIRIAHNDGTIGGYNAVVMSAEIKDAPTIIEAEGKENAN